MSDLMVELAIEGVRKAVDRIEAKIDQVIGHQEAMQAQLDALATQAALATIPPHFSGQTRKGLGA